MLQELFPLNYKSALTTGRNDDFRFTPGFLIKNQLRFPICATPHSLQPLFTHIMLTPISLLLTENQPPTEEPTFLQPYQAPLHSWRGPPIACAMKVSHCILSRLRLPTARLSATHDNLRVAALLQIVFAAVTAVRLLFPSEEGRFSI